MAAVNKILTHPFYIILKKVVKWTLLVLTMLFALLLLASAWGGRVNPANSTLFPVLNLALPFIFIANLVVMGLWLVMFRWRYALISLAAILLSWGSIRQVCPINVFSHAGKATKENSLRVLTFNVMNFGPYDQSNHNPSASMRYVLDQNVDVVVLQEGSQERDYMRLSNIEMMTDELKKKYPYRSDAYHDLMIFSKYPFTVVEDSTLRRDLGRVSMPEPRYQHYARGYDLQLPKGRQLRIVNLHLHTIGMVDRDKDLYMKITKNKVKSEEEFRKIKSSLYRKLGVSFKIHAQEAEMVRKFLDKCPKNVILCGDFNETPASYCYRTLRGDDMSDAFVDCGFGLKPTFHDKRMYFKIDHIMYRGDLKAVDWYRDKAGDSDHYPQVATFVWK